MTGFALLLGACAGLGGAVAFGLHHANHSDAFLSLVGNVVGNGVGAGLTITAALLGTRVERSRQLRDYNRARLSPISEFKRSVELLALEPAENLEAAFGHISAMRERLEEARDTAHEFYMRRAYVESLQAWEAGKDHLVELAQDLQDERVNRQKFNEAVFGMQNLLGVAWKRGFLPTF